MGLDEDNSEGEGAFYFTLEKEVRFERRYEESYDLYDPRYSAWLKYHHPESVPTSHAFDSEVPSTVDAFAHVPPAHPHELVSDNPTNTNHLPSSPTASPQLPNLSTLLLMCF